MYGDFQCPYCTAAQSIVRRVRARLDGRLRYAFRHLPLHEVHPDAQRAAEAAEAAAAQGRFWEMHDALYANGGRFAADDLAALAERLGLDVERFRAELTDGVLRGARRARRRRGARGGDRLDPGVHRQRPPSHRRLRRGLVGRRAGRLGRIRGRAVLP